jgi:opacity protein-like surface antigen
MRMTIVRVLFAAGFAVLLLLPAYPANAQPDFPDGLYLRGDIGSGIKGRITFRDVNPAAANCDLCNGSFPSTTGNSIFYGAGIGYRLTPLFRTDFTVDYLTPTSVEGHTVNIAPSTGSAHLDSGVALVNVYLDLDGVFPQQFGPFQPYLSAGIGVSRNHLGTTSGFSSLVGPFTLGAGDATRFAWAVGAGVAYPLNSFVTMDLAYRFMDLGEIRDGSTLAFGGASYPVTSSKSDDFISNAVTLGLRVGF